ncbi:hypothetical protein [Aliarcobacter butzleri]|uniref:hypothetical protein n=1 Tax=Aliarcobacter butzleri TaxID=28197 RepID=UPI0015874D2E|nr:hypothetical protein [Aliarcobacter butzleri]NUW28082.1 hypothetical protein [Aliarcobacter butzleri]
MKKSLVFATSIFTMSLLLTGCNNDDKEKFELSNTIDKTYLLNKQNGELFYIDNKTAKIGLNWTPMSE